MTKARKRPKGKGAMASARIARMDLETAAMGVGAAAGIVEAGPSGY